MQLNACSSLVDYLSAVIFSLYCAEKLLLRSSIPRPRRPCVRDPQNLQLVYRRANELRDMSRLLGRHRVARFRRCESVKYPPWKRGQGHYGLSALRQAIEHLAEIVGSTHWKRLFMSPSLRKYLEIVYAECDDIQKELAEVLGAEEALRASG